MIMKLYLACFQYHKYGRYICCILYVIPSLHVQSIFVKKSLVQSDLKHGITDLKMCFASGKFHCPFCLSNLNLILPGDTEKAVPPQS